MIEFKDVYKKYGDKEIVKPLNLKLEDGKIIGLLGPNGAGKTTLIKMACGIIDLDGGDILINNKSINKNIKEYSKDIGAILEGNRNIYWRLSPRENMKYFASIRGHKDKSLNNKIDELLKIFDIYDKRDIECRKLSRGMQQKVSICCSLITDSKVLFLDEPTLGLDVESILAMEEMLKSIISKDKTIVITSHDLSFIDSLCDKVIILNKGEIVFDDTYSSFKKYDNSVEYTVEINNDNTLQANDLNYNFRKDESSDKQIYTFILNNDNEIVDVLNKLTNLKLEIKSVTKKNINSEEIFKKIINENKLKKLGAIVNE